MANLRCKIIDNTAYVCYANNPDHQDWSLLTNTIDFFEGQSHPEVEYVKAEPAGSIIVLNPADTYYTGTHQVPSPFTYLRHLKELNLNEFDISGIYHYDEFFLFVGSETTNGTNLIGLENISIDGYGNNRMFANSYISNIADITKWVFSLPSVRLYETFKGAKWTLPDNTLDLSSWAKNVYNSEIDFRDTFAIYNGFDDGIDKLIISGWQCAESTLINFITDAEEVVFNDCSFWGTNNANAFINNTTAWKTADKITIRNVTFDSKNKVQPYKYVTDWSQCSTLELDNFTVCKNGGTEYGTWGFCNNESTDLQTIIARNLTIRVQQLASPLIVPHPTVTTRLLSNFYATGDDITRYVVNQPAGVKYFEGTNLPNSISTSPTCFLDVSQGGCLNSSLSEFGYYKRWVNTGASADQGYWMVANYKYTDYDDWEDIPLGTGWIGSNLNLETVKPYSSWTKFKMPPNSSYFFSSSPVTWCYLKTLDLADFDFTDVEDASHMFHCLVMRGQFRGLDTVEITDKCSNIQSMFESFDSGSVGANLVANLVGWDVSNVTNVDNCFSAFAKEIIIDGWDLSNVTPDGGLNGMFHGGSTDARYPHYTNKIYMRNVKLPRNHITPLGYSPLFSYFTSCLTEIHMEGVKYIPSRPDVTPNSVPVFKTCTKLQHIYVDPNTDWFPYYFATDTVFDDCPNLPNWNTGKVGREKLRVVENGGYLESNISKPDRWYRKDENDQWVDGIIFIKDDIYGWKIKRDV